MTPDRIRSADFSVTARIGAFTVMVAREETEKQNCGQAVKSFIKSPKINFITSFYLFIYLAIKCLIFNLPGRAD
jgi:hypothetical protein